MWKRGKFFTFLVSLQVVFLVLFAMFVEYSPEVSPKALPEESNQAQTNVRQSYGMFQDIHVMIFIGFGFLMTFLKRYGYSSVGINFVLASFVIQWSVLVSGFIGGGTITVTMDTLLFSDFASAAVLISMGAMLGKASPLQYIIMALFEIAVFHVNEYVGLTYFKVADIGGSIFVHVFGAYFGIACARFLNKKKDIEEAEDKAGSVYHSDHFAMIGTVFLWIFWPSFNSVTAADGDDQLRAIINTYFCLAACCVTTFAVSTMVQDKKFLMEHIQNATLAGGVAIGTMANMDVKIWGSVLIGVLSGALSVLGYRYISPFLSRRFSIHDTCGVNNLHGMPGIMAGLGGAAVSALASEEQYGSSFTAIWPERDPAGTNRSGTMQAAFQAAALGVTFLLAIVGGSITGLILRLPFFDPLKSEQMFDDSDFWVLPDSVTLEPPVVPSVAPANGDVTMATVENGKETLNEHPEVETSKI